MAIGQTIAKIWRFLRFSKWRSIAILDLEKNQNFNMHMHFSVNMHYRAKYYGDWSSSCRDMASHLEFVLSISHKEHLMVFITV